MVTRLGGGSSASGVLSGSVDGTGTSVLFSSLTGVAAAIYDTTGTIYVSDGNLIRMISSAGTNNAYRTCKQLATNECSDVELSL